MSHEAQASAPGKIILFGEHAVVYGRPAIAVPLSQLQASARLQAGPEPLMIVARDLATRYHLADAPSDDPLAQAVRVTLDYLHVDPPACTLFIESSIPIASGLGSGAAVSAAIIRAVGRFFGFELEPAQVSELAYNVEKIHHGTPSGIDNTVVAYGRPVYFVRGQTVQSFAIHTPFRLVIADTGIASPTRVAVGDVRAGWRADPGRYERLFDRIGATAESGRIAIERGSLHELGPLMNENQELLAQLGVSSPILDALTRAAVAGGAGGAKLSGAGRGGNLIALVSQETEDAVAQALTAAGAAGLITTWVGASTDGQETEAW